MAGFSAPGVGGGLDFTSILDQIRTAEQEKLVPYTKKQTAYTSQVSSWGKISSALSGLNDQLDNLGRDGFHHVNISNNKTFKASAASGAQADSYAITVQQLARAHKIGTAAQPAKTENLGDPQVQVRTLSITVGDGKPLDIELATDQTSLEQVVKTINQQKGEVSASLRSAENGSFRLVLTSKKTGDDGNIRVQVSGDEQLARVMNFDPQAAPGTGMSQLTASQNAVIVLDGTRLERSSNTITDAVEGLTLELQQVAEKDKDGNFMDENLSVTSDTSTFKESIESVVKLFNAFLRESASASAWQAPVNNSGAPNPANGALMGDSTLRRLTRDLRDAVESPYRAASQIFPSLAKIGIAVTLEDAAAGTLTIDSKKLEAAVRENPAEIETLFFGKGNTPGLADRLQGIIKKYLGDSDTLPKTTGVIEEITRGLKAQSAQVSTRMSQVEKMIDATVERNRKNFVNLDVALSKMNAMSNQLASMLKQL